MSDHVPEDRRRDSGEDKRPAALRGDPRTDAGGPVCDLCGSPMIDRHCKLACPTCGYQRDCSDP